MGLPVKTVGVFIGDDWGKLAVSHTHSYACPDHILHVHVKRSFLESNHPFEVSHCPPTAI